MYWLLIFVLLVLYTSVIIFVWDSKRFKGWKFAWDGNLYRVYVPFGQMLPFTRRVRRKPAQQHMSPIPDVDSDDCMHDEDEPAQKDSKGASNLNILLQNLRSLVRSYMDSHMYESALFWADKVVSISDGQPYDVFWLAQCMYYLKQYHRAAFCIQSRGLHKTYLVCRYLAAKCLMEAKEYTSALVLLTPEGKVKNSALHTDGTRCPMGGESRRSASAKLIFTDSFDAASEPKRQGGEPTHSCCATDISQGSGINMTEVVDTNLLPDLPTNRSNAMFNLVWSGNGPPFPGLESPDSAILFLKGCVYEALDNRKFSSCCFKSALMRDVFCYDAFEALIQHQMLASYEEQDLMRLLPFSSQCKSKAEEKFVRSIYESLLKKYHCVPARDSVKIPPRLKDNLDMLAAKAERSYYACSYTECIEITSNILSQDPNHSACLPIHVGCLVELKRGNDLFQLAHELLDQRPDLAVSWFAVGCYYYLKGKIDPSRRYLSKATALDKLFGPAWLAYGHTFAVENEHDQAMAAYFKSSQLMKGCHLPQLYIGIECGLTTNFKLADKFLREAKVIAPSDPFVIHELGVLAYQNLDYEKAEQLFEEALDRVAEVNEPILTCKWEPLYNNLGHVCRKLKKYEKALAYHNHALILVPLNPSTYASIGFIQAITGRLGEAADSFHRSLGLRRDDAFSTTMLNYVMEQLGQEPFPSDDEDISMPAPTTTTVARQVTPATSPTDTESVASITPPEKGSSPPRSINEEMDVQDTLMSDTT